MRGLFGDRGQQGFDQPQVTGLVLGAGANGARALAQLSAGGLPGGRNGVQLGSLPQCMVIARLRD
jgi:hypothetical protein